jgi:hypothetical protein
MELAQQIAIGIGTAAAAFGSTWTLLIRPLHNQVGTVQKQVGTVQTGFDEATLLRDRVLVLEQKVEELEEKQGGSQGKIERIQERHAKFVTSEEFATYSRATTEAVNGLTEKVGRAIGMLEARR